MNDYKRTEFKIRVNLEDALASLNEFNSYISNHSDYKELIEEGVLDPTCFIDLETNFNSLVKYLRIQTAEMKRATEENHELMCMVIRHLSDDELERIAASLQMRDMNISSSDLLTAAQKKKFSPEEYVALLPAIKTLETE